LQDDSVFAIVLIDLDYDIISSLSLNRSAAEIRFNRELAMPSIQEDRQLDSCWPPMTNQCIKRSPNRSSGENQFINEDNMLSGDLKRNFRLVFRTDRSIVSESADVKLATRNRDAFDLSHVKCESLCDWITTLQNANNDQVFRTLV
jgi:hypothetical protein